MPACLGARVKAKSATEYLQTNPGPGRHSPASEQYFTAVILTVSACNLQASDWSDAHLTWPLIGRRADLC